MKEIKNLYRYIELTFAWYGNRNYGCKRRFNVELLSYAPITNMVYKYQ